LGDASAIVRQPPPTLTTLAFVEVSEDGDREFTFYRSVPAADGLLSPDDVQREALSGVSFANFGSIPLMKEPARSATRAFAERRGDGRSGGLRRGPARKPVGGLGDGPQRDRAYAGSLHHRQAQRRRALARARNAGLGEATKVLLDRGVSLVLISTGDEGTFYATRKYDGSLPQFETDEILGATGARDAFLAATPTYLASQAHDARPFDARRRGGAIRLRGEPRSPLVRLPFCLGRRGPTHAKEDDLLLPSWLRL
jgi:fructokinase